jgi:hypothetical protein
MNHIAPVPAAPNNNAITFMVNIRSPTSMAGG